MILGIGGMLASSTSVALVEPGAIPIVGALENGAAAQQRSSLVQDLRIHAHDPQQLHWQLSDPSLPENVADALESCNAGAAVWLTLPAPATLIPAATKDQSVIFYHGDHLGSTAVMTDRNGSIVQETAYFPFGDMRHFHEPTVPSRQPYGFTGKEQDAESELQYFEARYLASALARFVTPDPKYASPGMLPSEELAAYLSIPQRTNAYSYVLNSPLIHTDPTGLDEQAQVARSVVEGLRQVNTKTGAFAEVIKTYDAPATHWLFVDDQSSVTVEKDRPPRWSEGGRRYAPIKFVGQPEDYVKPKYDMPDLAEWDSLPESNKAAHQDAYDRAKDRAVEVYREHAEADKRFRQSVEKENQFLPLMK